MKMHRPESIITTIYGYDPLWGVDVTAQTNKSYSDKYTMNSTGCFVKVGSRLLLFETERQTYS